MATRPPAETSGPQANLYPIVCDDDVVQFRHRVREAAIAAGLRLIDQTKLVTAASELARNALEHGGGGLGEVCAPETVGRTGVRLIALKREPTRREHRLGMRFHHHGVPG